MKLDAVRLFLVLSVATGCAAKRSPGTVGSPPKRTAELTELPAGSFRTVPIPVLLRIALARDDRSGESAADALLDEGEAAAAAIAVVVRYGDAREQDRAVSWLQRLGRRAAPARPALLERLNEIENDRSFLDALDAIFGASETGSIAQAPQVQAAVPRVIKLAADGDLEVAPVAVAYLGILDVPPDVAVPIIVRLPVRVHRAGGDRQQGLAKAVASHYALRGLDTRSVPHFIEAFDDADPLVRQSAAELLYESGLVTAADVPLLLSSLQHDDAAVRRAVIGIFAKLGPASRKALPALESVAAGDEDEGTRNAAGFALKQIRGQRSR